MLNHLFIPRYIISKSMLSLNFEIFYWYPFLSKSLNFRVTKLCVLKQYNINYICGKNQDLEGISKSLYIKKRNGNNQAYRYSSTSYITNTFRLNLQLGISILRSMSMTLGELNYESLYPAESFLKGNETSFTDFVNNLLSPGNFSVTNLTFSSFLFFVFMLAMPIVLMNLLVSCQISNLLCTLIVLGLSIY